MGRPPEDIRKRLEANKWIYGDHWRWLGAHTHNGYGVIWFNGKQERVSRLSAHLYLDFDLKSPLIICHKSLCEYKDCWNPNHLYVGTYIDNILDYRVTRIKDE